jgi:hypothetical protein
MPAPRVGSLLRQERVILEEACETLGKGPQAALLSPYRIARL